MNEVKQLFHDIKNIFKNEGVELDENPTETLEETKTKEITKDVEDKKEDENLDVKFEDVTMADGSVAQIEPDVSLGAAVVVQIGDELLPAPDGEHELADGRVITTESGTIVDVQDPMLEEVEEAPAEEIVEEVVEAKKNKPPFTDDQRREAKKIIESIVTEKHFASVEDTKHLNSEVVALKDAFKKLLELTEHLMSQPTTKSVKTNKSGYSRLKKEEKKDIITRIKERNIIN